MNNKPHTDDISEIVKELTKEAHLVKRYHTDDGSTEMSEALFGEKVRKALTAMYEKGKGDVIESLTTAFKDQSEIGVNHLLVELEALKNN